MTIPSFFYGRQFIFENLQAVRNRLNQVLTPQQQMIGAIALAALSCLAVIYTFSRCCVRQKKEIAKIEAFDERFLFSPRRVRKKPTGLAQSKLTPLQTTFLEQVSLRKGEQEQKESASPISSLSDKREEESPGEEKEHQRLETPKKVLTAPQTIHSEKVFSKKEQKNKEIFLTPQPRAIPGLDKRRAFDLGEERKYQWIATPKKVLTPKEQILQDQFEEGTLTGKASIEFPDGEKWTGDFKHSLFDGVGRIDFADGKVLEAEFEEGKMVNVIQLVFPNEEIEEVNPDAQDEDLLESSPVLSPLKKSEKREMPSPSNQLEEQDENLKKEESFTNPLEWLGGQKIEIKKVGSALEEDESSSRIPSEKIEQERELEKPEFTEEEDFRENVEISFSLIEVRETTDEQLTTIKAEDIEEQDPDDFERHDAKQEEDKKEEKQKLPLEVFDTKEKSREEQMRVTAPSCPKSPHLKIKEPLEEYREDVQKSFLVNKQDQLIEKQEPIALDLENAEKKEITPFSSQIEEQNKETPLPSSPVKKQQPDPQLLEGIFTPKGKNGYGKMKVAGDILDGEFKEGLLDCSFGKVILVDGTTQEGEYRRGKLYGVGKITYPNGDIIIGNFIEGYLEGQGKVEYADGRVLLGIFRKGVLQGTASVISPQRRMKSVEKKTPKEMPKQNKVLELLSSIKWK